MTDDDNLKQLVLAKRREWNSFWFWRDKPVGERDVARDILEAAKVQVNGLRPLDPDPPDCEATLDGQLSSIEVTELVHRATLERSIEYGQGNRSFSVVQKSPLCSMLVG